MVCNPIASLVTILWGMSFHCLVGYGIVGCLVPMPGLLRYSRVCNPIVSLLAARLLRHKQAQPYTCFIYQFYFYYAVVSSGVSFVGLTVPVEVISAKQKFDRLLKIHSWNLLPWRDGQTDRRLNEWDSVSWLTAWVNSVISHFAVMHNFCSGP